MNTQDTDTSSYIELEMDGPSEPKAPAMSPLAKALQAINTARSRDELASAIEPLRAWPEGPDKAKAREALRTREAWIRNLATAPSAPKATAPAPATPSAIWVAFALLWGSFIKAVADTKSYKPVFQCDDSGKWYDNAQRFATHDEAKRSAADRFMSWTMAKAYEAFPSTDPVNYTYVEGRSYSITAADLPGRQATIEAVKPADSLVPESIPAPRVVVAPIEAPTQPAETRPTYEPIPYVPAPSKTAMRQAYGSREIVIGAREAGTGVMVGWNGLGECTRARINAALGQAGLPQEWAPAPKSAHAQAAAALSVLLNQGRIVRAERGGKQRRRSLRDGFTRMYAARWTVGLANQADVGEKFGTTLLTAQLSTEGVLELECMVGEEALKEQVRGDYERRCDAEIYPAGDVTYWLRNVLISHFHAVRLGGMWYVPAKHADSAERLCAAMAQTWGTDWCLPALPVATTDQLRAGLVRGLIQAVTALLVEVDAADAQARKEKRIGIGAASAAKYLARLRDVNEQAKGYATMLGDDYVSDVKGAIASGIARLEPLCDASVQRFAALDMA